MAERTAIEFTGERVIPELVDADLLNEHLARYRFANRIVAGLARPAHVLDAGCGSGYGTAELSAAASVTAADISGEAVFHARRQYGRPAVRFLQAACESLPFADGVFDLVAAFEVIEHLDRWQDLVTEANRVLKPTGILLVSTPNRDYYAESRGASGPNPFHRHEFTFEEFGHALGAVFPHIRIWTQNHAGAIVFVPQNPDGALLDATGIQDTAAAHFYFAACSQTPIDANDTIAWLPSTANVLQERERHIAKLSGELEKKDAWLRQTVDAHGELQRQHEILTGELEHQNNWAGELNVEVTRRDARIEELQAEVAARMGWIVDLEAQLAKAHSEIERLRNEAEVRLAWVGDVEAQLAKARSEVERLGNEAEVRLAWVGDVEAQLAKARSEVERLGNEAEVRLAWVGDLEAQLARARGEVERLGNEAEIRLAWVGDLEAQLTRARKEVERLKHEDTVRLAWIADLESQIAEGVLEVGRVTAESEEIQMQAQARIQQLEATVIERSQWAERLNAEIAGYRAELNRIEATRWVRLGAVLGLGPKVSDGQ